MPTVRRPGDGAPRRATSLELFYDLAFVFAITQVSHLLLTHLTWAGAGQSLVVLAVVWWAWNYTTWVTNELDAESPVVRVLVLAVMLLSLLLAVAVPEAFGDRALLFAGCYVAIQVGRHTFLAFATAERGTLERARAERILIWFVASGVLWIAGALADGAARTVLWLLALALDYGAPLVTYRVPGLAPVAMDAWRIQTSHFAERFQLFIILALGESIVIIGATTAGFELDVGRIAAFVLAFLVTAAMWWLYFTYVALISERRLEQAENRTAMARDGFTYLHIVMAAGIIVAAVGHELVIAHPDHELAAAGLAAVGGGPALYLLGHALFRRRLAGSWSTKRLAGAAGCLLCALAGAVLPAIVTGLLVLGVLVGVIVAEERAATGRRARGEPSPLEQLATG
jgi:low temperature requirement protein LtrA